MRSSSLGLEVEKKYKIQVDNLKGNKAEDSRKLQKNISPDTIPQKLQVPCKNNKNNACFTSPRMKWIVCITISEIILVSIPLIVSAVQLSQE